MKNFIIVMIVFLLISIINCRDNKKVKVPDLEKSNKIIGKKNYKSPLPHIEKKAKQGNKIAQYNLGYMYKNGKGVSLNYKKAFYWYKKAAKQGHKTAQYNVGLFYDNGHTISTNYKKAFSWYKKAAIQGHKIAQKKIGFMYYYGIGVTQNHKKAKHWYEKAAEQGNKSAQYYLGLMYYFGEGVLKNHKKAFGWFEKSAKQGYIEAQKKLGNMYRYGYGVLKNIKKSAYWDQKGNNGKKKKTRKTLNKKELNFKSDNAAVYYSKAADLLVLPTYQKKKDVKMMIKNILRNGWKGKNKELRDILEQNKQSLHLLKRGFLLKKCDFNFGKKVKYIIFKKTPPLLKVLYMSNLCLLEGKYYEKNNSDKKAVELYLSICRFANHISQDGLTISRLISLAMANESYLSLTGYLKSKKVKKKEVKKILKYLEKHRKNHFLAKEVIEHEKEGFINSMEMLIEEQELQKTPELAKEIILISKTLVEKHYGNYAKAFDTNNDADWKFAEHEFDRFVEEESSSLTHVIDFITMYYNRENKKMKKNNKIVARKVVATSFIIYRGNFKLTFNKYQSSMKELNKVISLAKTLDKTY